MKKIRNGILAVIAVVFMTGFVLGGCDLFSSEGPEAYREKSFYMNGQTYDYVIENDDELKMLVWHTILFRQNDVKFYLDYPVSNLKTRVGKYIHDPAEDSNDYLEDVNSYPEYDGLEVYFYSEGGDIATDVVRRVGGNVWRLQNFKYYLDNDFTLTTANAESKDMSHLELTGSQPSLMEFRQDNFQPQKDHKFDMEYIEADIGNETDSPIERHFPIDDLETEVEVYNTTQLFMVAQYGAKPVFKDSTSVAYQVYENARNILREINNSDSLTDYEKALNIYNYIVQNVTYDHVLFDYMDQIGDSTVYAFGNFNIFHLEGVLYDLDNQVAVCDGLSKAFALMCRIEGIYSTKVNGVAGGGGYAFGGEHAWNEIELDGEYHIVDTTWGVSGYWGNNGDLSEYATRSYFLVDDDLPSHKAIFRVGNNDATDYNYYDKLTVEVGSESISHLVNTGVQLNKLVAYYEELANTLEKSVSFEIKLTETGFSSWWSIRNELSGLTYKENFVVPSDGYFVSVYVPYEA